MFESIPNNYNAVGEGEEDCKYEDSEEGSTRHAPDGGWNLKEFVAEKRCHVRQSDRQQPEEESWVEELSVLILCIALLWKLFVCISSILDIGTCSVLIVS